MRLLPQSLLFRIPLWCGVFTLAFLTLITILAGVQQYRLMHQQMEVFGNSQARQLALAVEQPLFMRDIVSLQVVVENNAASTNVFQTRIHDSNDHPLAESARKRISSASELINFEHPVILENETIGKVTVILDRAWWQQHYLRPWHQLIVANLSLALFAMLAAFGFSLYLTRKLKQLLAGLPELEEAVEGDELERLQHRLAPLLTRDTEHHDPDAEDDQGNHYALLACQLNNLSRLRAQLSHENYQSQLQHFDRALAHVCRLYQGKRIQGHYGMVLIRFMGPGIEDNHLERALLCARLISQYLAETTPASGINLEIRLAVCQSRYDPEVTPLLQEQQNNDLEDQLFDMLELGATSEILLSSDVASHLQPRGMGDSEEFSEEAAVFLWKEFTPQFQALIDKQLVFLRRSTD